MTRAEFLQRFPHASEACIRANCVDAVVKRPAGTPATGQPAALAALREPVRVKTADPRCLPVKAKGTLVHESSARHRRSAATAASLANAATAYERAQADHRRAAAELERHLRDGPLAAGQAEGIHCGKFLVRVTSFRRRLLDEDNLCEKYVVDCCRYAGLLPGDDPGQAHIVTTQEKVGRKEDERTEVVISRVKN